MLMPDVIHPLALIYFRFFGGMVLFWLVSLFVKSEKVSRKDLFLLFLASIFAMNLNQLFFFGGLSMTTPIDASIVVTTMPIVTMILAALILKEPLTRLKTVGVLVGAAGALLLVFTHQDFNAGSGNFKGNMIVFLAVTAFSLYLTLFKDLISRYSPITVMKWMFLFASVTGLPVSYSALSTVNWASLTPHHWLMVGFVVFFATFFGYLLLPVGQKNIRPTTLSMYNYVQPIVASLVAVMAGMESFGYNQAMASVLVFSGVYIVTQSKSREQIEKERLAKAVRESGKT